MVLTSGACTRAQFVRAPGSSDASSLLEVPSATPPATPPPETPTPPAAPPPPSTCPIATKQLLIIDLKSGWWAGDGAGTFESLSSYVKGRCSQVLMEYGHITLADPPARVNAFPSQSFDSYDEIWVLSGAIEDTLDIRTEGAVFQRLLQGIVNSKANLFLGAGSGSFYHFNAITTALGWGNVASSGTGGGETIIFLKGDGSDTIAIESALPPPQLQTSAAQLFLSVASLPDVVSVQGVKLVTDFLSPHPSLEPLHIKAGGIIEIAQGQFNGRRVVMDANLARFYPVLNSDPDVRNYMVNLIRYLE